jgi:hypothetical protein
MTSHIVSCGRFKRAVSWRIGEDRVSKGRGQKAEGRGKGKKDEGRRMRREADEFNNGLGSRWLTEFSDGYRKDGDQFVRLPDERLRSGCVWLERRDEP